MFVGWGGAGNWPWDWWITLLVVWIIVLLVFNALGFFLQRRGWSPFKLLCDFQWCVKNDWQPGPLSAGRLVDKWTPSNCGVQVSMTSKFCFLNWFVIFFPQVASDQTYADFILPQSRLRSENYCRGRERKRACVQFQRYYWTLFMLLLAVAYLGIVICLLSSFHQCWLILFCLAYLFIHVEC